MKCISTNLNWAQLRIEYPGAFYHVMNHGLERRGIFRDKKDYEAFLHYCLEIHKRFKVIFHAYSLMPNHYHLMVETLEGNLSRAMRHLDGVYTQGFNRRKGKKRRVGALFQGEISSDPDRERGLFSAVEPVYPSQSCEGEKRQSSGGS